MSWQLLSFLILGAALLGGFAWYERSRPPSQVVALVAALAALAIGGRVAFAAFPNVKPTTDVVVFAGYALGAAPGFVVGALAALVSNFWFGQGPWTPWQMAGWGLCGLLGAALALGVRNAGRLTLAATCGFAGIAFGTLLNFSLMATYGGELSWRHFGVLEARAVPFEVAALVGNVVFALVAGPAMVRMLVRFRERFEWVRKKGAKSTQASGEGPRSRSGSGGPRPRLRGGAAIGLLVAVLALGALAPSPARASEVGSAATWLAAQQNSDGGFGAAPGDSSGAAMTGWTMLGLEAAGRNPLDVSRGGKTPVDFLRSQVGELKSPGDLARTIVALEGAGVDPRSFGGDNLVAELLAKRRGNGSFEGWPTTTAFAVVALRTAGATGGMKSTLSWLQQAQNSDGGWGDTPGSPSTADDTGAVMQALSPESKAVHRGLSYLRQAQRPGGGFPLGGGAVNTQSTAWAIQGILAAGGDPDSFRRGGKSAPEYLAAQQEGDGHFRYSKSSDQTPIWVTGQVLVAAAGDYLPISPPPREPTPKPKSKSRTTPPSHSSPSGSSSSANSTTPAISPLGVSGAHSESAPNSSKGSASGGAGSPPERFATPGQSTPGASAGIFPPGSRVSGGSGTAAPQPAEASPSTDSPSSSHGSDSSAIAGAVLIGLLAGCLAFLAALGVRRWWMRWRYGW